MAGDWIPMQTDLHRRIEVAKIADACGVSRYEAVGMLLHFWGWVSAETVDGRVDVSVDAAVDILKLPSVFLSSMCSAGWLDITASGVAVPNYDRWLSNGAKARLQKTKRQQRWREGKKETVDGRVDGAAPTIEQDRTVQGDKPPNPLGTRKKKGKDLNGYCQSFEAWWLAYPRREGKQKAFEAWTEAGRYVKEKKTWDSARVVAFLQQAAEMYGKSPRGHWPLAKIPHPATWLNQRRFEDDPATWEAAYADDGNGRLNPGETQTVKTDFTPDKPYRG